MQLHAGEGDALITPVHRDDMLEHLRKVYNLLNASEQLDYAYHDAGHLFDWPQAAPFLHRHLGG
jgi:hypothetical protein